MDNFKEKEPGADNSNEKALSELLALGIITKDEYDEKIRKISVLREKSEKNKKNLDALNELLDLGIITDEEYQKKKNAIEDKVNTKPINRTISNEKEPSKKVKNSKKRSIIFIAAIITVIVIAGVGLYFADNHNYADTSAESLSGDWIYSETLNNNTSYHEDIDSVIQLFPSGKVIVIINGCTFQGTWEEKAAGNNTVIALSGSITNGKSSYVKDLISTLRYNVSSGKLYWCEGNSIYHYYKKYH